MADIYKAEGEWTPAFEGQRPPFAEGNPYRVGEGNTLAEKHGASSPRRVDPIAQGIMAEALADPSLEYLQAPRFGAAVLAWARSEAKVALVDAWVDGMSLEEASASGQGRTSPLELLRKYEVLASNHRSRLGLDPLSAARLGKDVAQARSADAATALTALREAHERSQRGEVVPDGE